MSSANEKSGRAPREAADGRDIAEFVAAAAELAATPIQDPARLDRFVGLYPRVVIDSRHTRNSGAAADRTRMLVHGMVGAATLSEALGIFVEFTPTLFPGTPAELREEGADLAIIFHEEHSSDPQGLICALWPLVVASTELEFLAGGPLDGLAGRVANLDCLPPSVVQFLFPRPLTYDAAETALVIPKIQLARSVAVRAADVGPFVADMFQATIGAKRPAHDLPTAVAELVRVGALRADAGDAAGMPRIAEHLGCSVAALRRRLHLTGTSFRKIREAALDELAKTLLKQTSLSLKASPSSLATVTHIRCGAPFGAATASRRFTIADSRSIQDRLSQAAHLRPGEVDRLKG